MFFEPFNDFSDRAISLDGRDLCHVSGELFQILERFLR